MLKFVMCFVGIMKKKLYPDIVPGDFPKSSKHILILLLLFSEPNIKVLYIQKDFKLKQNIISSVFLISNR